MRKIFSDFSVLSLAGVMVFCLIFNFNTRWEGNSWNWSITSDGKGYYAYLPALFIYNDFQYSFAEDIEKRYYGNHELGAFYTIEHEGKRVNKYFGGESLLLLPFFLLATFVAFLAGFPVDGFSLPFQIGVGVAALFYLFWGLYFLRKTLLGYGLSPWATGLTLLLLPLGTNLLYYVAIEPSMSHVYSFAAISCFIFLVRTFDRKAEGKILFLLLLVYGLIVFIRPVNGLVALSVFFLSEQPGAFLRNVFSPRMRVSFVSGMLLGIAIPFLQTALYFLQTGKFWVWSYGEEGFNFSDPHVWEILFGWRKGLFVYCPVLLLSLPGLYFFGKGQMRKALLFLAFLLLVAYVVSSWWCWWYGGSYGMRALIDYFPFFGLLLGFSLVKIKPRLIYFSLIPLGFLVFVSTVQTWQAHKLIIPWDGMTFQKYQRIFLKTDDRFIGIFTDNAFIPENGSREGKVVFFNDFDPGYTWWDMNSITDKRAFSGKHSSVIGNGNKKSVSFGKSIRHLIPDSVSSASVFASMKVYSEDINTDAVLVISFEREGKSYSWKTRRLITMINETGKWLEISGKEKFPGDFQRDDILTVYLLAEKSGPVYIDDFRIAIDY
jgi:hypothetical protein